jgi:protein-L-isoaspartate(D-aspartate) O-methyltransferase
VIDRAIGVIVRVMTSTALMTRTVTHLASYPRSVDRPPDPRTFEAARAAMISGQLRARGIVDERVLAAMASIPRERFVPAGSPDLAYADQAVAIGASQTISQPWMVAMMSQLLDPPPGDRVLEIGTGSGYQAAVLAAMGCDVLGIERLPELAEAARGRLDALGLGDRVEIRVGDGSLGAPDFEPWARIIVAAAAPAVPNALTAQLADGGRLVIPVGGRWEQELILVERRGADFVTTNHGPCVFVPLLGAGGWTSGSGGGM